MKEKRTDDLRQELMNDADIDLYLRDNEDVFSRRSIAEQLVELLDRRQISKAALARTAGISEVYLHQVFSARRFPSRDRLICICMGLEASLEETQNLLKEASYAPLYPKNRRDAIVSYGILHGMSPDQENQKLFSENERTLF